MPETEEEVATYPCPACGRELYGWSAARHPIDGSKIVLDHCEHCRLVVTRAPGAPDIASEIEALQRDGAAIVAPNRRSFQGGIGGAQWAGLEPDRRRLHLNPDAIALLLDKRGISVTRSRARFSLRGYLAMWQTLINAFTLRDNFAPNARAGRYPRANGRERAAFALDCLVTAVVALPLAVVALPLELLAALAGRGGVMRVEGIALGVDSAQSTADSATAE